MSRHLHLDPFSGVAGDMFLGVLADLGWPAPELEALPRRLGLSDVEVRVGRAQRGALAAARVHVLVRGEEEPPATALGQTPPGRGGPAGVGGSERDLGELLAILARADLPPAARDVARRAFEHLFRAEGKVHGVAPEAVHLHEAGADDALVDVAGVALGLLDLGVTSVSCTAPLPVGGGMIQCSHGALPVPGPAVAELLLGVPVVGGPVERELITPTGAALLRAVVDEFRPLPPMTIERTGCGAGGRDDSTLPNVLRGFLGVLEAGPLERTIAILETTLDDMLPQDLPPLVERLFAAGARDAWVTPVQMKKGRPGFNLTVIADPADEMTLSQVLLHDSPTLGVRRRRETRLEWARDVISVPTPWGPVRVKRALDRGGRLLRGQPEFEDCRRAAEAAGVPVDEVRRRAREALDRGAAKQPDPAGPDKDRR